MAIQHRRLPPRGAPVVPQCQVRRSCAAGRDGVAADHPQAALGAIARQPGRHQYRYNTRCALMGSCTSVLTFEPHVDRQAHRFSFSKIEVRIRNNIQSSRRNPMCAMAHRRPRLAWQDGLLPYLTRSQTLVVRSRTISRTSSNIQGILVTESYGELRRITVGCSWRGSVRPAFWLYFPPFRPPQSCPAEQAFLRRRQLKLHPPNLSVFRVPEIAPDRPHGTSIGASHVPGPLWHPPFTHAVDAGQSASPAHDTPTHPCVWA